MNSMFRIVASLVFLGSSLAAQLGFAGVTYTYTGNNFTNVVDDPSVPGTYSTSMHVSGTFELSSALPPNRSLNDDVIPLSFSFGDGRSVITNTSPGLNVQAFRIATDATGNITQWQLSLISQSGFAQSTIIATSAQSNGIPFDQGNYRLDVRTTNEDLANTHVRGSWIAAPPPVPERKVVGPASEPSIAADPLNTLHAVVGFNDLSAKPATPCGWAESWDGGSSWSAGSIRLPVGFIPLGDPWVRYGSNGELYYSCIGRTPFRAPGSRINPFFRESTVGIFVAVARPRTGSTSGAAAMDFGSATAVTTSKQFCTTTLSQLLNPCGEEADAGEFTDHPSLSVLKAPNGTIRLVVCFVELSAPSAGSAPISGFTRVAYSVDGINWSRPQTIGGPRASACNVGGSNTQLGVTWLDGTDRTLKLRTSTNGTLWTSTVTLASVGPIVNNVSTSSIVLSVPYALAPGKNGLQAVWQSRVASPTGYMSQVTVGPAVSNSSGRVLGDPATEKFLPSAGGCRSLLGAYEVTDSSRGLFKYRVWSLDNSRNTQPIFSSGADFDSTAAESDSRFPGFKRIGDYTGVDCAGDSAWAAWTDLRNGQPEVWAARIPLSN